MSRIVTDEQFRDLVKDIHGDDIWPTEPYRGNKTNIGFQCACGHRWRPKPNNITSVNPTGCPECAQKTPKMSDNEYKARVNEIWGDKIWPTETYQGSLTKIGFQCHCGHTWRPKASSTVRLCSPRPTGCPKCEKRKGAQKRALSDRDYKDRLFNRHNGSISLIGSYYPGKDKNCMFVCNTCKHEWMGRGWWPISPKSAGCPGKCRLAARLGLPLEELDALHGIKKRCNKCRIVKFVEEFCKDSNSADGRNHYCRECTKIDIASLDSNARAQRQRRDREYAIATRDRRSKRVMERLRTDIQYKIAFTMRSRVRRALKGSRKSASTLVLLGCTVNQLKDYLAAKFKRCMTWDNYGTYWDIDHKFPCSRFNLTLESEQRICFHFTNLQPLRKRDNLAKGSKITDPQMSLCI